MKLNLGCCDHLLPSADGWVNVDLPEGLPTKVDPQYVTEAVDLRGAWPWADGSVDYILARDIFEHLPDRVHTFNEAYRVLKPGGLLEVIVPTTDGRGAWQDPTHVSYFNRNFFFYVEHGNPHLTRFQKQNGMRCAYRIVRERQEELADEVVRLTMLLEAVK